LGTKAEKGGILVAELPFKTMKALKTHLFKEVKRGLNRRTGVVRRADRHQETRQKLDEMLLAFRAARIAAGERRGWLRAVRQVVGIPVKEVARRLGVCKWEVLRLEKAESESTITLRMLRRGAEALDCDLVYALTPRQGTLEELAAEQRAAREKEREAALELVRKEEKERESKVLKVIGWRREVRRSVRRGLRKLGVRVR
jgi:predicted DNA-binding mobile mystery protein A